MYLKQYWWVIPLLGIYTGLPEFLEINDPKSMMLTILNQGWYHYSTDLAKSNDGSGIVRGLAFLLALPVAFVALFLAAQRTVAQSTQSQTDSNRLLSESFAKSIELLGHDESSVRQGAIYALGKIAETNKEEYLVVILNTLCAFVREKRYYDEEKDKDNTLLNIEIDIEAAIRTISKISKSISKQTSEKYDLSNIQLKRADFSHAKLSNFNLSDSVFDSCIFENVKFYSSNLVNVNFKNSNFKNSKFDKNTEVRKANFSKSHELNKEEINKASCYKEAELPEETTSLK